MKNYRDLLLSQAFRVVPGELYNLVSFELRREFRHIFYEIILPEDAPWEYLREKVMPPFVRYCEFKSIYPESTSRLIISLFYQNRFYLFRGREFLKAFREIERADRDRPGHFLQKWKKET
jgi:hypothetical protein